MDILHKLKNWTAHASWGQAKVIQEAHDEIERLRKAYGLVRDAHEDTAKELSKYIRLSGDQIDEIERLRKRDGFINILDKQIVAKDAEIERLRDELEIAYAASRSEDIEEIERLREALKSIAANTCCDNCQEAALVARAALRGDEK